MGSGPIMRRGTRVQTSVRCIILLRQRNTAQMVSRSRIPAYLAIAAFAADLGCRPDAAVIAPQTGPRTTDDTTAAREAEEAEPPATARAEPPPADARETESGLRYVLRRGTDETSPPTEHDAVTVRYRVRHRHGEVVRETPDDRPAETLELQWLPPGWAEGMRLMRPGDRATLWLPAELAYGEDGPGPTGPLVIDVELVDVVRRDLARRELPIAAPPSDAISTPEGLQYVHIRQGEGDRTPGRSDWIRAHYQGFTTDGTMFDSSYDRGQPLEFRPEMVIEGWVLMLSRMVEGDKVRVWIPEALAYQGRPGKPAGVLVFDIEFIEFVR